MNHPTNNDSSAADMRQDEEYAMPCAEALLASSMALMTGYVQGCCDDHRTLMAQKIVQQLAGLSQHPLLSPDFKTMLWNLHTRWLQQLRLDGTAEMLPPTDPAHASLWHKTHEVLQ